MIESRSVEEVKARIDIVDVIANYIELKKSGANFKANCPFHGENTPSFVISPSKQIYKCFGCGVGGDAIKFVMEYEKLTYPEAIEKLADQFGIHLQYSDNHQDSFHDKKILENYNLFLRKQLNYSGEAKNYLLSRGLYQSSIEKFELGYAPSSNLTLDFLRQNSVPLNEALELGLIAKGDNNRIYARFTNRVIFPIFTPAGKIVGFGGRIITQRTDIGKYINSPQGKVFDKSTLLYGYHKAKNSIMQKGEVIVVEGNLDVIMLHQAGFTNSVATLGTALTDKHVPILVRGNPKIILAYDGDQAGVNAAFKASTLLSHKGLQGGVVIFADGVDPADMIKAKKIDEINQLFHKPKPLIEFCLEHISKKYNLANPMQKEEALKESTTYLKTLSPILQEEYKGYLSAILNIRENLIEIDSSSTPKPQKREFKKYNQRESIKTHLPIPNSPKEDIAELTILKTILEKPHLVDFLLDIVDDNIFQTHKEEFQYIIQNKMDHPKVIGIQIRENIVTLQDDELKNQLIFMLRRNCENELNKIKNLRDISLTQKSFMIRKVRERIMSLKRGKLV